jgi:hypothetical protein
MPRTALSQRRGAVLGSAELPVVIGPKESLPLGVIGDRPALRRQSSGTTEPVCAHVHLRGSDGALVVVEVLA